VYLRIHCKGSCGQPARGNPPEWGERGRITTPDLEICMSRNVMEGVGFERILEELLYLTENEKCRNRSAEAGRLIQQEYRRSDGKELEDEHVFFFLWM
jgi:hypothetical protein